MHENWSMTIPEKAVAPVTGGRICLMRPHSQARAGTGKSSYFSGQLTTSRIGNDTRLIRTLLKELTIHTNIPSEVMVVRKIVRRDHQ